MQERMRVIVISLCMCVIIFKGVYNYFLTLSLSIGSSDFKELQPIKFENNAEIHLFTTNDAITLEYNDTVILRFTPDNPLLIAGVESRGEYIRHSATVKIMDNDRKLAKW